MLQYDFHFFNVQYVLFLDFFLLQQPHNLDSGHLVSELSVQNFTAYDILHIPDGLDYVCIELDDFFNGLLLLHVCQNVIDAEGFSRSRRPCYHEYFVLIFIFSAETVFDVSTDLLDFLISVIEVLGHFVATQVLKNSLATHLQRHEGGLYIGFL